MDLRSGVLRVGLSEAALRDAPGFQVGMMSMFAVGGLCCCCVVVPITALPAFRFLRNGELFVFDARMKCICNLGACACLLVLKRIFVTITPS